MVSWNELPKFKFLANYRVDVGFEYVEKWIEDYAMDGDICLNPDFQRGHIWNENQQIKYVEYLIKGGMSSKDIYWNHPGWMRDWEGELVLVDGLQRLTAIRRFGKNEIPVFGYYNHQLEGLPPVGFHVRFHVNVLQTRKEVLEWYLDLNDGGVVHTTEELNRVRDLLSKE